MAASRERLIISIDIGTSQSAVTAYYRGAASFTKPVVTFIDGWPGQENRMHEQKVPSVVLYSADGECIDCGASALAKERGGDDDDDWFLIKHFKMHLHPKATVAQNNLPLEQLPTGVLLLNVYSDFMKYLLNHTRKRLEEIIGHDVWLQLQDRAEIVIAHPNRWGADQQRLLQQAALMTGLISQDGAINRLFFLEEGEASASFAVATAPALAARIKVGTGIIICDTGGSTSDISAYNVTSIDKDNTHLREVKLPSCRYAGGVRVDELFKNHLSNLLDTVEDEETQEERSYLMADGLQDFASTVKCKFISSSVRHSVAVGGRRMNIEHLKIKKGQLSLNGTEVEGFFRPSVDEIINELRRRVATHTSQQKPFILLTGGFSESPYVKFKITEAFGPDYVILANPPNSKAVAIGGLKLQIGGGGTVIIDRVERTWATLANNLVRRIRVAAGRNHG